MEIGKANCTHNHPIDINIFKVYPKQRKVPKEGVSLISKLINEDVPIASIQKICKSDFNSKITKKDLDKMKHKKKANNTEEEKL